MFVCLIRGLRLHGLPVVVVDLTDDLLHVVHLSLRLVVQLPLVPLLGFDLLLLLGSQDVPRGVLAFLPGEVLCPEVSHVVHQTAEPGLLRHSSYRTVQEEAGYRLLNLLETENNKLNFCSSSQPGRYLQSNILLLLLPLQQALRVLLVLEVDALLELLQPLLPGLQSSCSPSLPALRVVRAGPPSKPGLNLPAQILKTKQIFSQINPRTAGW